ncbi:hypothetical protein [Plastoroseomonas arctica]|uniref:Uncharacterized protein n=1 Tax=Plastoroseomonas arctica TaxID=1509237 RepID=A0AAF1K216_9PROT|nr:hypothetical protein [Plastoroseomonas arctica]MBR0654954.1 hypothetical protein [Plastoroseomonas arctica]
MATRGIPLWPWLDQAADDLPGPERLLLDAARLWQEEAKAGRPPAPALRMLLASADAGAALEPLDALLRLSPWGTAPFACRFCPGIHPAEGGLLLATALAQRGAERESLAIWLRWLPLLGACQALSLGARLAAALRDAGHALREPWAAGGPR